MAEAAAIAHMVAASQPQPQPEPEPEPLVVHDEPAEPEVPIYYQRDERWGGLPYADGDLSSSGCGLTCAAMAWEYLSGQTCTPAQLLNLVGNDYVQDGQNYMPGFCEWMAQQDPTLEYSVLYEDMGRALDDSGAGRLVFGAMQGRLVEDGESYGGHIVLITKVDDGLVTIHDPCMVYAVQLTLDQFELVDWNYFISIGRSE